MSAESTLWRSRFRAQQGRRWAMLAWAMAAVVLVIISGCATIPTHGTVGKSDPLAPRQNEVNVNLQQFGPVPGASPEDIIRGFIDSGTGIRDDFQVARQYLTPGLAQSWAPDKRTLVYKNVFTVTSGQEKDSYELKFDVVSSVDATGVLTPAKEAATESVVMKMVQVEGQWRISEAPDGLVLTDANFQTLFSPFALYFYDPSFTYGVPDVRWLAARSSRTSTVIVKAMLDGPAPYLKGAVVSAFPNGIALDRDSVPVTDGVAKVGLTSKPLLETSVKQRQQMHAQLLMTLQKSVNTVTDVQFLADDREVDMGGSSDAVPPMIIDNSVPSAQVALANNELVAFDGSKAVPIQGMPAVAELVPSAPAIAYSGKVYAFRSGTAGNQIYAVAPGQQPVLAISGVSLTAPSFAPNGWLWAAAGDGSGLVIAVRPDETGKLGAPVLLTVPWLVGQDVTSFRVSRDGTRALVVSHANGSSKVSVTGILRSSDVPKELTAPLALAHAGTPLLGVWMGESTVAVSTTSGGEPVVVEILDLARDPVSLDPLAGIDWISAGSGVRNVHADTSAGLFANMGNNWQLLTKDVRQASFAG